MTMSPRLVMQFVKRPAASSDHWQCGPCIGHLGRGPRCHQVVEVLCDAVGQVEGATCGRITQRAPNSSMPSRRWLSSWR